MAADPLVSAELHPLSDTQAGVLADLPRLRPGQRLRIAGLKGAARAFFVARCLQHQPRPTLCVLDSDQAAEAFAADLRLFLGQPEPNGADRQTPLTPHLYPAWDVPAFEGLSPSGDVVAAQLEGLYYLLSLSAPVIVTCAEALSQRVMPQEEFMTATRRLGRGQETPLTEVADTLLEWGYRRVPVVEEKGELSVRGGLLDVFPPLSEAPVRIEFFGDVVESVRTFDPSSQRSRSSLDEAMLLPMRFFSVARLQAAKRPIEAALAAGELPHREQQRLIENVKSGLLFPGAEAFLPWVYPELESVWDYLPRNTLVWLVDPLALEAGLDQGWEALSQRAEAAHQHGHFAAQPEQLYVRPDGLREQLAASPVCELPGLEHREADRTVSSSLLRSVLPKAGAGGLAGLAERLRQWQEERAQVFLSVSSRVQAAQLQELLLGHELESPIVSAAEWRTLAPKPGLTILTSPVSQGFVLPADGLVFIAEEEIFGERRHRRRARPRPVADYLTGLSQLQVGDYVVHIDHGIGRYQGLRHLSVADTEGDYLQLEYAGGDRLYLPVERINLVQKYAGSGERSPALDRLSSQKWERVKRKTREAILAMARELLEMHAVREATQRPVLAVDGPEYREFVAGFPFEETRGQQLAIDDVLADLNSPKPMDRLVCGDVGYGKTEVALRAAFLSVLGGKQVAVLVPTTVLAQQHAETFARRFADYPMRVEVLNRFRSAQDARAVVRGLADGQVDIVIGTHRLLQRDIVFKRLGLIVIDEEHRFGVAHKEKIKKLRHLVDVLTLSATPIPRTLNMGLIGLRDLSVIETPPVDRQAIRTYVTRFDEDLIRSAILRELERGGQVFFVHNRVETIERMADQLRALVPEASLAVGHGQMAERDLETVMLDFLHHRTNVLLCSSIIESGLDIPTANTIIINRADQFGLAQLYQLRGRVGRAAQRAFAYLLIPGQHRLTKDASRRLEVLEELDDLGGGFRLAAHDLEIRGAGNLLGKEQSGNVTAVGFELYAQMLEETVTELRGGRITVQIEPEIQLGIPAYIPEAYIPDVNQRLVFYKRLANVEARDELEELGEELEDRFGPLPELVLSLIEVMDLRRVLRACLVTAVSKRAESVTIHFHPDSPIKPERLVAFIEHDKRPSQLTPDLRLSLGLKPGEDVIRSVRTLLHDLGESC